MRYYESQSPIAPTRTASGYRDYDAADIVRIEQIRTLMGAGLSTELIAGIIPCLSGETNKVVVPCRRSRELLRHELDHIDASIAHLQDAREMLLSIPREN